MMSKLLFLVLALLLIDQVLSSGRIHTGVSDYFWSSWSSNSGSSYQQHFFSQPSHSLANWPPRSGLDHHQQQQQRHHHDQQQQSVVPPTAAPVSSSFSCRHRPPGYYADIQLNCQVYHLCNRNGGGISFECPQGTRFQQRTMVCDHTYSVNCSEAYKYYDANLRIGHRNVNLLDDDHRDPETDGVKMQVVVRQNSHKNPMMQLVVQDSPERRKIATSYSRISFYPEKLSVNRSLASKKLQSDESALPRDHPLRSVLPHKARVVGIKPASHTDPNVMGVKEFLELNKHVDTIHVVPIPLDEPDHVQMVKDLAAKPVLPSSGERNVSAILQQLADIIMTKGSNSVEEVSMRPKTKAKKAGKLALQPRGGMPSSRFASTETSPRLEYGFQPITTTISTRGRSSSSAHFNRSSSRSDLLLDENDELSAPRPPRSDGEDAFFFTTTTTPSPATAASMQKPPHQLLQFQAKNHQQEKIHFSKASQDMRKFFFIPKSKSRNDLLPGPEPFGLHTG